MVLILRGKDEVGRVRCVIVMEEWGGLEVHSKVPRGLLGGMLRCDDSTAVTGAPFADGIPQIIAVGSYLMCDDQHCHHV